MYKIMDNLVIRKIETNDYDKKYLDLLTQLTTIDKNKITKNMFSNFVQSLNENHIIFVIEVDNKIIATTTLLIENKLIHEMGKVGHIEDVVVDKKYNGKNVGKTLIEFVCEHGKNQKCYKIILDCSDNVTKFYEKCGFSIKGNLMTMYF